MATDLAKEFMVPEFSVPKPISDGPRAEGWTGEEVSTGTTIIAMEFDGGVVIGADSRTSSGSMVVNRVTDKLTKLSDMIYCCRSGSAAHTQLVADHVSYWLSMHSTQLGEVPRVKTAASMFHKICYSNRDGLVAGIICAGWDPVDGGQVYCIPLGGMCVRQPFSIGGSGSTYLYGYCDATYKEDMSKEECQEFVKNCVALAISRDGSSGGVIRLATISKSGVERDLFTGDDIPKFYDELSRATTH